MSEHKVYGIILNDDVMYSEDPLVITMEILGTIGCSYDLHEVTQEYKRIWCSGWESREKASDDLSAGLFYQRYTKFKTTILSVINCNSGNHYGIGKEVEGIKVFLRYMSDKEFYMMPEYN